MAQWLGCQAYNHEVVNVIPGPECVLCSCARHFVSHCSNSFRYRGSLVLSCSICCLFLGQHRWQGEERLVWMDDLVFHKQSFLDYLGLEIVIYHNKMIIVPKGVAKVGHMP